jgi:hypothetical protein
MRFEQALSQSFILYPLQELAFNHQESDPKFRVLACETPELSNGNFYALIKLIICRWPPIYLHGTNGFLSFLQRLEKWPILL